MYLPYPQCYHCLFSVQLFEKKRKEKTADFEVESLCKYLVWISDPHCTGDFYIWIPGEKFLLFRCQMNNVHIPHSDFFSGVLIKYRPKPLGNFGPPKKTVIPQYSSTDDSDALVPEGKPVILDKAPTVKSPCMLFFGSLSLFSKSKTNVNVLNK